MIPTTRIPWDDNAAAYAKAHVAAGILRIDADGRIWREFVWMLARGWRRIEPRRVENVGGKGYLRVSLSIPGARRLAIVMAHRLVYECLVGPIPQGLEINHKDLNKTNNRPNNLEPVTGPQNIQHSYANGRTRPWSRAREQGRHWRDGRAILTDKQMTEATHMRDAGASLKSIAMHFGIGISHAHRITGGAR